MGGGSSCTWIPSTGDESLSGKYFHHGLVDSSFDSSEDESWNTELENGSMINGEIVLGVDSISEAIDKQRNKVCKQVCNCYEDIHCGTERLMEAKSRVLSYTPGSWVDKSANDMVWDEYVIPNTTSLLLLGPRASGKSTLVNNISKVFDDGLFASRRAHVSCHSAGGGTRYVQRYIVPRRTGSFCLYDTHSLSDDTSENLKEIKSWMTKGVHHGELVVRESDNSNGKVQLMYRRRSCSSQPTSINFVIFVVNGVSVLDAMDAGNDSKRRYCQKMATIFNYPLLSFRDDKPVVVVTHGDLLSVSDRVRIRLYLAELLGIHPTQEIFDIPDNNDPATALEIADMLTYCLECADRNLAVKEQLVDKILGYSFVGRMLVLMVLSIIIFFQVMAIAISTDIYATGELASNSTLINCQVPMITGQI